MNRRRSERGEQFCLAGGSSGASISAEPQHDLLSNAAHELPTAIEFVDEFPRIEWANCLAMSFGSTRPRITRAASGRLSLRKQFTF